MKKLIVSGLVVAGATFTGGLFVYNDVGGVYGMDDTIVLLGMLALLGGSVFVVLKSILDNRD